MISGVAVAFVMVACQAINGLPAGEPLHWLEDYGQAMHLAKRDGRMLLVEFCADGSQGKLAGLFAADAELRASASRYTLVRIPLSTTASVGGERTQLIRHASFAELGGRPGLAIIDLRDPDSEHFGYVVSIYPFSSGAARPDSHAIGVLLNLPTGSLTQRTLIFAVRTHPERPASTDGEFLEDLAEESESHSQYQASITSQGHHHWGSRFHRINARLPGGLLSREVCAESWPGQGLLAAAIECVRSWRHSSGHWGAVRARHRFYGYDMKRGRNGVWYATGIFAVGR